jgi:hypothetical protein
MSRETQWANVEYPADVYHVIPVADLKDHEDGFFCWCKPSVKRYSDGGAMVTHNSLDGREFYERQEHTGH